MTESRNGETPNPFEHVIAQIELIKEMAKQVDESQGITANALTQLLLSDVGRLIHRLNVKIDALIEDKEPKIIMP